MNERRRQWLLTALMTGAVMGFARLAVAQTTPSQPHRQREPGPQLGEIVGPRLDSTLLQVTASKPKHLLIGYVDGTRGGMRWPDEPNADVPLTYTPNANLVVDEADRIFGRFGIPMNIVAFREGHPAGPIENDDTAFVLRLVDHGYQDGRRAQLDLQASFEDAASTTLWTGQVQCGFSGMMTEQRDVYAANQRGAIHATLQIIANDLQAKRLI
ncbi:hypothetical protein LGM58_37550 [Burkholderia contaminans]|uniref:hypothetical protein n=1 Tax=Burkholderia contaminans TaxID=488447 RepID=UPI001CF1AD6B|nr:hypothetical protein [Burkholderia contaminans]MCA7888888.1 hypothetical protein [Burkholderia contaminans]